MSKSKITAAQAAEALRNADCLLDRGQVEAALEKMAEQIIADLSDSDPLVLCVINGGVIPAGQLLTRLHFPLQIEMIHATRYRGETSGSELHWLLYPKQSLNGRTVLIIDDILDEGYTLKAIVDHCIQEGAAEVRSAVLVEKLHNRRCEGAHADYIGLEVEDRYVFGYGMDYHDYLRNVDGIYAIDESVDKG